MQQGVTYSGYSCLWLKGVFSLTHTVQSQSPASVCKNAPIYTGEADIDDLLVSVCDSLNHLCTALNKLDYALERRIFYIESNQHKENRGQYET